jgi:NAD(P)-dependent dehydrogenase (short-subunit alcohol dehydrogenase family)
MLNAGTSLNASTKSPYEDVSYFQKTLNTNMYGVVNGLATFLPNVRETAKSNPNTKSAVIITGSKQGITNPPGAGNPAYNMSKSALKTLAEHLAYDLRTSGNPTFAPNVSVHLLIPGWTFTGLSGNVGPTPSEEAIKKKPDGAWLPSQVVEYAEKKINNQEFYIVCPDNDVDEALDEARMKWASTDVSEGRPALSRWEDSYKDRAAEWIASEAEKRRKGQS